MARMGSYIRIGYIYVSIYLLVPYEKYNGDFHIIHNGDFDIYMYIYIYGFHKWGIMDGKSQNIMDGLRGYHHFRKPPYMYIYIYIL